MEDGRRWIDLEARIAEGQAVVRQAEILFIYYTRRKKTLNNLVVARGGAECSDQSLLADFAKSIIEEASACRILKNKREKLSKYLEEWVEETRFTPTRACSPLVTVGEDKGAD